MQFGGIKVPGHTGTDFKHKKVFKQTEKTLINQPIFVDVKLEQREQHPKYAWFSIAKVIFVLGFLTVVFILLAGFNSKISQLNVDNKEIQHVPFLTTSEKQKAAILMYESGKALYEKEDYQEAQDEITRVLKLYPYDIESIELMHKILIKQCKTKNMYCSDAEEYNQYLARVKLK